MSGPGSRLRRGEELSVKNDLRDSMGRWAASKGTKRTVSFTAPAISRLAPSASLAHRRCERQGLAPPEPAERPPL